MLFRYVERSATRILFPMVSDSNVPSSTETRLAIKEVRPRKTSSRLRRLGQSCSGVWTSRTLFPQSTARGWIRPTTFTLYLGTKSPIGVAGNLLFGGFSVFMSPISQSNSFEHPPTCGAKFSIIFDNSYFSYIGLNSSLCVKLSSTKKSRYDSFNFRHNFFGSSIKFKSFYF
jgi:hypothetical protein